MNLHRLGSALVAVVAAVSMGACGGGDEGGVTPTGPHYHYVFNKVLVPTSQAQVTQYGLDLNGDGEVDNAVGKALASIVTLLGFDIQGSVDRAVLSGRLIGLADLQTPDFTSAAGAGIRVFLGSNPQPPACSGASDTVVCTMAKPAVCTGCGKHLSNGSFSIASTSPDDPAITGKINGGTFTGGPGTMSLLISLGDADPIRFDLVNAKVKASGISEATIGTSAGAAITDGVVLAGIITEASVDNTVLPGIKAQLDSTLTKGGCQASGPPTCGCADTDDGKTAKSILSVLDAAPKDCKISPEEVKAQAPLLLKSDLTVDGKPAYSAGIKIAATKATFTVPGE